MNENLLLNDFPKKERKPFGERLKELRTYYGLTQVDFAEMIGLVSATVISYEKGQKTPSIEIVSNIAEKFNVSLNWLCGFTDIMERIFPMTYADILKKIFEITNCKTTILIEEVKVDITPSIKKVKMLYLGNKKIQKFIDEYEKMYNLYKNNTIDKDLFDIWFKRQLENYDGAKNRIEKSKDFSSAENDKYDFFEGLDDNGDGTIETLDETIEYKKGEIISIEENLPF